MSDSGQKSRVNKFDKRRKTTNAITVLLIIGVVLVIVLLFFLIFGGNGSGSTDPEQASSEIQREDDSNIDYTRGDEDEENQEETDDESEKDKSDDREDKETDTDDEDDDEDEDEDKVETKEVESSDDNVIKAYEGDWEPVGTTQSGPHTTNYNDGSQDRIEIQKAVQTATGLQDMIELWIGNGGDQKVVATVSSTDKAEIYRVYLSWIDEEGWQPTKVEELKEADI